MSGAGVLPVEFVSGAGIPHRIWHIWPRRCTYPSTEIAGAIDHMSPVVPYARVHHALHGEPRFAAQVFRWLTVEGGASCSFCRGTHHEQGRNGISCAAVQILHLSCHSVIAVFPNSAQEWGHRHHTPSHADIPSLWWDMWLDMKPGPSRAWRQNNHRRHLHLQVGRQVQRHVGIMHRRRRSCFLGCVWHGNRKAWSMPAISSSLHLVNCSAADSEAKPVFACLFRSWRIVHIARIWISSAPWAILNILA